MHHRWAILATLTTWIVASSHSVLHTHGGNCQHDVTTTRNLPVHTACPHGHDHNQQDESESPPGWSPKCVVCELLALSIVVPAPSKPESAELQVVTSSLFDAEQPGTPLQRNWQGRAPPSSQLT